MENTQPNDGLEYIGAGASLSGVPARNLSTEEAARYGRQWLIKSGLYRPYKPIYTPKPSRKAEIKTTRSEDAKSVSEE